VANILLFAATPKLGEFLGKKGHKLFSFTAKEAALDCARSQKLDLALVEADNPAGIELLQELRQLNPDLRLITMTGSPGLPLLRLAISLGVQEILFTPLDPEELEGKVIKVVKATKRNLKEALALQ
jgi:DNA-binding NtrC family response regulator